MRLAAAPAPPPPLPLRRPWAAGAAVRTSRSSVRSWPPPAPATPLTRACLLAASPSNDDAAGAGHHARLRRDRTLFCYTSD